MKKIIFLLLVAFYSLQATAQQPKTQATNEASPKQIENTFTQGVDKMLQGLDKSPITSHILIDRVFPVAGIQVFNQGVRKDTSSFTHFKQAWLELYNASYRKNFTPLKQFKQTLKNKRYAENVIPIGIINTEFHQANFGTTPANATVNFDKKPT